MAKSEEGEFELILGNRQLLSVFFIVVVLLAVFFAMGYVVGRSSAPVAIADTAIAPKPEATQPETKPLTADSAAPQPAQPPAAGIPAEKAAPPPAKISPLPAASTGALSGTYLQLAATSQHEAEVLADVLRKKNFNALTAEIPEKPGTFRVLVGPLPNGSINKTRIDLNGAGFPGDQAIRRVF